VGLRKFQIINIFHHERIHDYEKSWGIFQQKTWKNVLRFLEFWLQDKKILESD